MNRIKQLREEKKWSQNLLAEKINCAPSSIAMYEKGLRKPSLDVLIGLSEIFDCTIDYLMGESEYKNYEEFKKIDELTLNYKRSPQETKLLCDTLNYINTHPDVPIGDIINIFTKDLPVDKKDIFKSIINHLHYIYNNKLPEKYDKDEQKFRSKYHKDMEGLTDEEISDALRFYKEMKNKVKGDK